MLNKDFILWFYSDNVDIFALKNLYRQLLLVMICLMMISRLLQRGHRMVGRRLWRQKLGKAQQLCLWRKSLYILFQLLFLCINNMINFQALLVVGFIYLFHTGYLNVM